MSDLVVCKCCKRDGLSSSMHSEQEGHVCFLCKPEGLLTSVNRAFQSARGISAFFEIHPERVNASIKNANHQLHFKMEGGQFHLWGGDSTKRLKADV